MGREGLNNWGNGLYLKGEAGEGGEGKMSFHPEVGMVSKHKWGAQTQVYSSLTYCFIQLVQANCPPQNDVCGKAPCASGIFQGSLP